MKLLEQFISNHCGRSAILTLNSLLNTLFFHKTKFPNYYLKCFWQKRWWTSEYNAEISLSHSQVFGETLDIHDGGHRLGRNRVLGKWKITFKNLGQGENTDEIYEIYNWYDVSFCINAPLSENCRFAEHIYMYSICMQKLRDRAVIAYRNNADHRLFFS